MEKPGEVDDPGMRQPLVGSVRLSETLVVMTYHEVLVTAKLDHPAHRVYNGRAISVYQ